VEEKRGGLLRKRLVVRISRTVEKYVSVRRSNTSCFFPHQMATEPVMPLVDSRAQHLIQKRIAVEKLTSWCVSVCVSVCLCVSVLLFVSRFAVCINCLLKYLGKL